MRSLWILMVCAGLLSVCGGSSDHDPDTFEDGCRALCQLAAGCEGPVELCTEGCMGEFANPSDTCLDVFQELRECRDDIGCENLPQGATSCAQVIALVDEACM